MIRSLRSFAHGFADELVTGLITRPKLYPDGFGDLDRLAELVERVRSYDASKPPPEIAVRWLGDAQTDPNMDGTLRRGEFESPVAQLLPAEARIAPLELWTPVRSNGHRPPICLLLATTGDEGFGLRRKLTRRLLAHGIGTLLLENPFYGERRPHAQFMSVLRTVEHQFAMNAATVDEARSLLAWLRDDGYEQIGASGYSQGGMMTAFAAALSDFEVAAIPRGAGLSAVPIFTENTLSRRFHWDRLAKDFGDRERARQHLARCLEPVDVGRFPPPHNTDLCIIVASSYDRFIPQRESQALHDHWSGSEIRYLDAGHLTGALQTDAHVRAIRDAFDRFDG